MPNLINTDSAGNVFYNYITPVVKGETYAQASFTDMGLILTEKLGAEGGLWNFSDNYGWRLPAPGLENGLPPSRHFWFPDKPGFGMNSSTTDSVLNVFKLTLTATTHVSRNVFCVLNDYAFVYARFNSTVTALEAFHYVGWLREPIYTGSLFTKSQCVLATGLGSFFVTPLTPNTTNQSPISTAADSITSPPIVCTTETDPGDGSETFTDIVIRDAASPNNPVGKLWNCIDLPATATVGGLYKNVGAYDGDDSASEQDVYLCVMPWGERKLGMRVWTENV